VTEPTSAEERRKRCCMCRRRKSLHLFNKDKHRPSGFSSRCRACNRRHCQDQYSKHHKRYAARNHSNRYGMLPGEYDTRLAAQGGVCAVCGEPPQGKRRLAVDHDPVTRRVRGLLCSRCNTGLGQMRDDPRLLRAAAEYLERFRAL
jgi:hypothetical protein